MMSYIVANLAANAVESTVQTIADYMATIQCQETRRLEIAAHHDIVIHALNQERDIILAYFNHTFTERRLVLEQCLDLMDKAIDASDHESLNLSLSTILGVIHENPLKDFATFKHRMSEPGFQIVL
jgi:hypothetical protein